MFNFDDTKERIREIEGHLVRELGGIRTGRATPAVLDGVVVEVYGSRMALRELGNITIEDSHSIKFEPWDKSVLHDVEKSIAMSSLGISPTPFEGGLHIIFPSLTQERRKEFVKSAKGKCEEARVSLRQLRDKIWGQIQEKEKEGGMGEDDKFRLKAQLQKMIDDSGVVLDAALEKKEKEILN